MGLFMLLGAFMAFGPAGFVIMLVLIACYYKLPQALYRQYQERNYWRR